MITENAVAVMVVAITPRLLLRHWDVADVGAADHIYGDPETMRYFNDGQTYSPAELAASFPRIIEDYRVLGYGNYAVVERATNRILGHCGAHHSPLHDRVEADWALERTSWGRGYATEAAQAVFLRSFSIDALPRIVGVAHCDNAASIAVMRRLGMQFCGEVTANGTPSVLYAIERDDFALPPAVLAGIEIPPANRQVGS